ncbi:hypothetical protein N39L_56920 [Limnospira platensis NIES-39]|nr:hypothetical protein N39L_56920 [Arthrospira platensis NIES-39]
MLKLHPPRSQATTMKNFVVNQFNTFGLAFWVEIMTEMPRCTYYFGPFLTENEAEEAEPGYIEDIQGEGATGLQVAVKRCQPDILTVAADLDQNFDNPLQWA